MSFFRIGSRFKIIAGLTLTLFNTGWTVFNNHYVKNLQTLCEKVGVPSAQVMDFCPSIYIFYFSEFKPAYVKSAYVTGSRNQYLQ